MIKESRLRELAKIEQVAHERFGIVQPANRVAPVGGADEEANLNSLSQEPTRRRLAPGARM